MCPQRAIDAFVERVYWLIRLRWLAVVGTVAAACTVCLFLDVKLPLQYIFLIAGTIAAYNLVFYFILKSDAFKDKNKDCMLHVRAVAAVQIFLDLTSLTFLLHFSGGIENPFIFFYIFHVIIASILLSRKMAFLQVTYAIVLLYIMVFGESLGYLRHYSLSPIIVVGKLLCVEIYTKLFNPFYPDSLHSVLYGYFCFSEVERKREYSGCGKQTARR